MRGKITKIHKKFLKNYKKLPKISINTKEIKNKKLILKFVKVSET